MIACELCGYRSPDGLTRHPETGEELCEECYNETDSDLNDRFPLIGAELRAALDGGDFFRFRLDI